jgi:enoyl-CoA hydratase
MDLEREQRGFVQLLTLNRPKAANSLDPGLLGDLGRAFDEIADDDDTRVVVMTGAGDRVFCAGMDLKAFSEQSAKPADAPPPEAGSEGGGAGSEGGGAGSEGGGAGSEGGGGQGFNLFQNPCPKPIIAAVNGAAVGGGFELVLACDLAVAADNARFGLPEVKRGLLAGGGGTLLGTRLPLALALEIALTGEYIDASRAAALGLVNRVVPADQLIESSLELAAVIAANGPLAIQTTKELTRRAVLEDPKSGWAQPDEIARVFGSDDAKEGAVAFLEKRAPNWTGH